MRVRNGNIETWPSRLSRCLRTWKMLQEGPVHVGHLARRFGVDTRSIQRDLSELRAAGCGLRAQRAGMSSGGHCNG